MVELGEGTLPLEKFQWYMKQDYLFLIDFSRVIALAVAKAETLEDMGWFARLLHETLNTEMSLHVSFCKDFGITEDELLATRLSPTTLAYTDHMLSNAHSGTIAEIAATLLPCSWGYAEIGQTLETRGKPMNQPLYCRWIEMYSSTEFGELAEWLRSFMDRTALGLSDAQREQVDEDIRHEQQIRISLLGCRVPDGGLVRLGCITEFELLYTCARNILYEYRNKISEKYP